MIIPNIWKNKHVPNHQSDMIFCWFERNTVAQHRRPPAVSPASMGTDPAINGDFRYRPSRQQLQHDMHQGSSDLAVPISEHSSLLFVDGSFDLIGLVALLVVLSDLCGDGSQTMGSPSVYIKIYGCPSP